MKKKLFYVAIALVVAICALTLCACKDEAVDPVKDVNGKIQNISAVTRAEVVTEVKTSAGDLISRETSAYTFGSAAASVHTEVTVLNAEDDGIGETSGNGTELYVTSSTDASLSSSDALEDIHSGINIDSSLFAGDYIYESTDGGNTFSFELSSDQETSFLGITEDQAAKISGVYVVITSVGDKITGMLITCNTNQGNVVRIQISYTY